MANELGPKILQFAKNKKGTIVRRKGRPKSQEAQCWDLPEEALSRAGAKTSWMYFEDQRKAGKAKSSDFGDEEYDYVWGKPVEVSSARPGDIIQFRSQKQEYTLNYDFTVGRGKEAFNCSGDIRDQKRGPQHSAVVTKLYGNGWVEVLEQHVNRARPARSTVVGYGEVFLKAGTFDMTENDTISGKWARKLKRRMSSKDCRKLVDRIAKKYSGPVRVRIRATAKSSGITTVYRPQKK
ncbi:MAG: hypothetical protein PVF33_01575 [Candidatus Latescibacterota bacterium]|jgi:hypothetical protein